MELKQILSNIEQAHKDLLSLQETANQQRLVNEQVAAGLAVREKAVAGLESAAATLAAAKKLHDEAVQLHVDLSTAQADFDNYKNETLKKISAERDALIPLQDLQKQLQADKAALEKEKLEYAERIRKELLEHFKNTNGK